MRPIDADALKKSITDYHAGLFPRYISKLVDSEIEDIKDIIDEQITLDYAPVVHREWEKRTLWFGSWGENDMTCSECRKRYPFHAEYNFCPNCGAKMDGGKKDG